MLAEDLLGTWQLVDWTQEYDRGDTVYPMGQCPNGYLTYDMHGRMICLISSRERDRFTSGGQWDASDAEKALAYDHTLAYGGTWELVNGGVIHHVDLSLFPNWIGGSQRRNAELAGGLLSLTARLEDGTGEARTARLTWRRLSAGG